MIVVVTGTPGTGKTKISKLVASKLGLKYLDINKVIQTKKLVCGFDKERHSNIVDEKKLGHELILYAKKYDHLVIDGHLSHLLPSKYVDMCIVAKCDIKILKKRLEKRHYNKNKIRENLDCEIFDVILNEAIELNHNIMPIDTSRRIRLFSEAPFSK